MRRSILSTALIAALPLLSSGAALAEDESPFTANVSLVSDYQYRGWSQTNEEMALQGGFDFAHPSGFYAGVWGSNVSWLADADPDVSNSLEVDIYAGYKMEAGPIGLDFGLLQYYYPGDYPKGFNDPDTLEGYVGASWEFLTFKYSYSFTDLFGASDSEGSQYFDLGASYEVGAGVTLGAHFGRQKIEGSGNVSYNDWKIGATKELGGFNFGLHYVDTDVDHNDLADARVILSVAKSF